MKIVLVLLQFYDFCKSSAWASCLIELLCAFVQYPIPFNH